MYIIQTSKLLTQLVTTIQYISPTGFQSTMYLEILGYYRGIKYKSEN